ncbi:hypothetical protein D3C84_565230 [compost metagenome]
MQQVAGGARHVAQLAGGTGEEGAGKHAVVLADARVGGEVGVAHQGADSQAAFGCGFDSVQGQVVDVDQLRRRLDVQLHQVQQVGAAGDEARAIDLGGERGGFGRRLGA